jgi:chemotaxis protein CheD
MLLAKVAGGGQARALSGVNAMEVLINALIKSGAQRHRLKAKAFGGARMVQGLSDIGAQNADFTVTFLAKEGIPLVTRSFGGTQARNLRFWPTTGKALQKMTDATVRDVEIGDSQALGHDVELF